MTSPSNRRAEKQERDYVGLFRSLRIRRFCRLMARWQKVELFQHLFFRPQSSFSSYEVSFDLESVKDITSSLSNTFPLKFNFT